MRNLLTVVLVVVLSVPAWSEQEEAPSRPVTPEINGWDSTMGRLGWDYLVKEKANRYLAVGLAVYETLLIRWTIREVKTERHRLNSRLARSNPSAEMVRAIRDVNLAEIEVLHSEGHLSQSSRHALLQAVEQAGDREFAARLRVSLALSHEQGPAPTSVGVGASPLTHFSDALEETTRLRQELSDSVLRSADEASFQRAAAAYETSLTRLSATFNQLNPSNGLVEAVEKVKGIAEAPVQSAIASVLNLSEEGATESSPMARLEKAYASMQKQSVVEVERLRNLVDDTVLNVKEAEAAKARLKAIEPLEQVSQRAVAGVDQIAADAVQKLAGKRQSFLEFRRNAYELLKSDAELALARMKRLGIQGGKAIWGGRLLGVRWPSLYYAKHAVLMLGLPAFVVGVSYYNQVEAAANRRTQDRHVANRERESRELLEKMSQTDEGRTKSRLFQLVKGWSRVQAMEDSFLADKDCPYQLENPTVDNASAAEVAVLRDSVKLDELLGVQPKAQSEHEFWVKIYEKVIGEHYPSLLSLRSDQQDELTPLLNQLATEAETAFDRLDAEETAQEQRYREMEEQAYLQFQMMAGDLAGRRWRRYYEMVGRVEIAWEKMRAKEKSAIAGIPSPLKVAEAIQKAPEVEALKELFGEKLYKSFELGDAFHDEASFVTLFQNIFAKNEQLKAIPEAEKTKLIPLLAQAAAGAFTVPAEKGVPAGVAPVPAPGNASGPQQPATEDNNPAK